MVSNVHLPFSIAFLAATAMLGGTARSQERIADYSVDELVAAVTDRLTSIETLYSEFSYQFSNSPTPTKCRYARSG